MMAMRVIAGLYKGRRLFSPRDDSVRPTTDRVKEAIFSIAQPMIEDAVCLDLFAGSGALGIEALSRGASHVYFCDNSKESLSLVTQNLEHVGASPKSATLIGMGWKAAIARIAGKAEDVELVFIDAPYSLCEYYLEILALLEQSGILADEAWVFVERDVKNDGYLQDLPETAAVRSKKYGNTAVDMIYYEKGLK